MKPQKKIKNLILMFVTLISYNLLDSTATLADTENTSYLLFKISVDNFPTTDIKQSYKIPLSKKLLSHFKGSSESFNGRTELRCTPATEDSSHSNYKSQHTYFIHQASNDKKLVSMRFWGSGKYKLDGVEKFKKQDQINLLYPNFQAINVRHSLYFHHYGEDDGNSEGGEIFQATISSHIKYLDATSDELDSAILAAVYAKDDSVIVTGDNQGNPNFRMACKFN